MHLTLRGTLLTAPQLRSLWAELLLLKPMVVSESEQEMKHAIETFFKEVNDEIICWQAVLLTKVLWSAPEPLE